MRKLVFRLLSLYRRMSLIGIRTSGKTPAQHAAQRVVSGRAWEEFCDALKAAGASVSMSGTPKDPLTQAEGYRYLTRLLRGGLEAFLEYGDPAHPELRRTVHETVKIGADNPDNAYYNAAVSGEYSYRIHGTRGTVKRVSLHMQRGSYGSSGGLKPAGKLEADELTLDEQGRFEVIASVARPAEDRADWLLMTPDTSLFMVRQTFGDRNRETAADVHIERIEESAGAEEHSGTGQPSGDGAEPRSLTPELLDNALTQVCAFVAGTSTVFTRWAIGFKKHPNELPLFDEKVSTNAGGDPSISYYHSYWRLRESEALVIHSRVPECEYWNFQLNDFWMESLDYRYYRIHINQDTAALNDDGSVTIVVAHEDPGHPNWLTTTGHRCGTMCFRWIRPQEAPPQPRTRVVSLQMLSDELPGEMSEPSV